MLAHLVLSAATKTAADPVTSLINHTHSLLGGWALPLASLCIVAGALVWMAMGSIGSATHAALGIRAIFIGVIGVAIVGAALSLASMGSSL